MPNLPTNLKTASINTLTSFFSPPGKYARLSILLYHSIPRESDALLYDLKDSHVFDTQVSFLSDNFNVLPLHEAVQRLRENTLPSRAACITFDDGYANNAEVALPILQKYGVVATFFIAAGFINGGMMWNDKLIELIRRAPGSELDLNEIGFGTFQIGTLKQRQKTLCTVVEKFKYLPHDEKHARLEELCHLVSVTLPQNVMMTAEQIKQLHLAGMEIGGHTVNHPILTRLDRETAYTEIENGKKILEEIVQAPVRLFAYPNGKPGQDYSPDHVAILKEIGFDAAVSTAWGAATKDTDIFQLPRFTPWDTNRSRFMLRMMQNMFRTIPSVS